MTSEPLEAGPERAGINSNDPELIQKYLDQTYSARFTITRPEGADQSVCSCTHSRVDVDTFAIEEISHTGQVQLRAEHVPAVVALCVLGGRVEVQHGGFVESAEQGQWILASTGLGGVRITLTDAQLRSVVVSKALLAEVAAIDTESPAVPRFTGLTPAGTTSHALDATERFLDSLLTPEDASDDPIVLRSAGRMLASAVLSTFPNDLPADSPDVDPNADQPALLRQAVAFIQENASRDISVRDIAAALYLSPRTVQYLFRRHLNTTPTAYLRTIRLAQARKELIAGDRSMTTVAATAARWGFAHTGRFAVLYRRTYGESPHETLRR